MKHVMVDLETLGVNPGCVVLSIGACTFDREKIHDTFTAHIDIKAQTEAGQRIEGATLEWWLGNKLKLAGHIQAPVEVLLEFAKWLLIQRNGSMRIWANSPMFDMAILGEMYRIHGGGSALPWNYWELRDYRTAIHFLNKPAKKILKGRPVAHHALQDAIDQAHVLIHFGFFERYTEEG